MGNGVGTGSFVDVIGNPHAPLSVTQVLGFQGPLLFNPAAFGDPSGLTPRDAGRNALNTCYGGLNNSAGDPSCVATSNFLHPSGAHNPRILRLGLKFIF